MSAQMLEVSLLIVLGVGTVLRLERDAWSMVKWLRQATQMSTPASMFEISIPYATVYYTTPPPGAIFHARLLDNQEGANTERYTSAFGKLSTINASNVDLLPTGTTFPTGAEIR